VTDDPTDDERSAEELRRGSTLVALGILASRLTGLVREVATASFLGVGVGAEAFKAALRIPNLLQNLLGEGVLSASFVPVYSQMVADGRKREAGRLAGAVAGLLLLVTSSIVILTVLFAPAITRVLAWGFTPGEDRYELTVTLVRIITPGVGLLVLSAWCLGILNSHRRFFLSYVAPVLWNAAIIAALVIGALLTTSEVGLARAMAIGALVGSAAQFLVQLPTVRKLAPYLRLSFSFAITGVSTVARRFGQVLAGRGSVQLGSYVDLFVASLLAAGGVAALTYAQALYLLPVALFGMSVAAAELPALSTIDHSDRAKVVARLDAGLGRVAYFIAPTMIAFLVAGDHIVRLILQWGRFSPGAAAQVGAILAAYGLGLLASTWSRLLQSALYGSGDARTPALYAVIRVVVSLIIGIAVMLPLDAVGVGATGYEVVGDPGWSFASAAERDAGESLLRLGAAGIAIGAAIGAWCEFGLLRIRIRVVFGRVRPGGSRGRAIATSSAMAAAGGLLVRVLVGGTDVHPRLQALLVLGTIGTVYLVGTWLARVPQANEVLGRVGLRRR
jgi:putative peptidoglycan lipid II flippase